MGREGPGPSPVNPVWVSAMGVDPEGDFFAEIAGFCLDPITVLLCGLAPAVVGLTALAVVGVLDGCTAVYRLATNR